MRTTARRVAAASPIRVKRMTSIQIQRLVLLWGVGAIVGLAAIKTQSYKKKEGVVQRVHEDTVEERSGSLAHPRGSDRKDESVGRNKQRAVLKSEEQCHAEDGQFKSEMPPQPREEQAAEERLFKKRNDKTPAHDGDSPRCCGCSLEALRVSGPGGDLLGDTVRIAESESEAEVGEHNDAESGDPDTGGEEGVADAAGSERDRRRRSWSERDAESGEKR